MSVVTPTTAAAPAGWYRDPLGLPQLRWWNGISWTNNIQEQRPELLGTEGGYAAERSALAGAGAVA